MKKGILILAILAVSLLVMSCGGVSSPTVSYERLDIPQAHFSIDYPSWWMQDANGVFHGTVGGSSVTVCLISTNPTEFDVNAAGWESKVVDGISYSVFPPRIVDSKLNSAYMRELSDEVIIVLISEIGEDAPQTDRDKLDGFCTHMVESLALSGE